MITIKAYGFHSYDVTGDDIDRAREAAEQALREAGVSESDAFAAYKSQWQEHEDEARMSGAALTWLKARAAAEAAITVGWANQSAEVICQMEA